LRPRTISPRPTSPTHAASTIRMIAVFDEPPDPPDGDTGEALVSPATTT
jgi:hypothetical protein